MNIARRAALRDDHDRMRHFASLDRQQQAQAIRRLAATGMTDHDISHATRLAVEQIRTMLGEHNV
jgi:hypothetical protein